MKVAALYDIHANLPALEAVLADVHRQGADRLVIGGDVLPGPMPEETLSLLLGLDLPVRFIQGNGDRAVLAHLSGGESPDVPERVRTVVRWVAQQLSPDRAQLLAGWPKTLALEIPGLGEVLFCHATPRSDTEIFTRLTPEERVAPAFAGVRAPLVVCGHTHMQFDRTIGGQRVVNAGSVGQPFGEPGACWLLLGPEVSHQHTTYDFAQAAERIRATAYPSREDFATRSILHPPPEEEMLEIYSRVDLR